MLLKLLAATVLGFICSRIGYEPLHRDDVPETFRYAAGVLIVVTAMPLFLGGDGEKRKDAIIGALMSAIGVGMGVALNRIVSSD